MKVVAIICEFNPLHNGHALLIKKAKELTGADAILCVMSGNFVQRAEPSILDSRVRARAALLCGADLVVELPALYSTACADRFSEGAVNIISSIKNVTHIAFGSECGDIEFLKKVASVQVQESDEFKSRLREFLDSGISYPRALGLATKSELGLETEVNLPNDLLGIEYLKALKRCGDKVQAVTIKRIGSHHDSELKGEFSSSSAVRGTVLGKNFSQAKKALPKYVQKLVVDELKKWSVNYKLMEQFVVLALRLNDLSVCPDSGEGLDIKLKKAAQEFVLLDDIFGSAKSKRYTLARIKRLALQSVLGITHYPTIGEFKIPSRLIGVKKDLKGVLLPLMPKNIIVQNKDFDNYVAELGCEKDKAACEYIEKISANASLIYPLLQGKNGLFYKSEGLLEV